MKKFTMLALAGTLLSLGACTGFDQPDHVLNLAAKAVKEGDYATFASTLSEAAAQDLGSRASFEALRSETADIVSLKINSMQKIDEQIISTRERIQTIAIQFSGASATNPAALVGRAEVKCDIKVSLRVGPPRGQTQTQTNNCLITRIEK